VGSQDAFAAEADAGHRLMGFSENALFYVWLGHSKVLFT
jgi:hypothetical protein